MPVIARCTNHQTLVVVRSLVDFIYLAHYPLISESDLEAMSASLTEFHRYKWIFIQNGSQGQKGHLRIPKLHALLHYLENSYQLGILDNFSTEMPESLHISMCKDPYNASNRCEFNSQILNYLDIQDQLTLQQFYENRTTLEDKVRYSSLLFGHSMLIDACCRGQIPISVSHLPSINLSSRLQSGPTCKWSTSPRFPRCMKSHSLLH